MVRISLKKKELDAFLGIVEMKGRDEKGQVGIQANNCVINCKDGVISTEAIGALETCAIKVKQNATVKESGDICIGDIVDFGRYLNRFEGEDIIDVYDKDAKIVIEREKPKKTMRYPMTNRIDIKSNANASKYFGAFTCDGRVVKTAGILLDTKIVMEAKYIKDAILDGDTTGVRKYPFTITKDKFLIQVGDPKMGEFDVEIQTQDILFPENTTVVKGYYIHGLDNIFSSLSGEIEVYLGNKLLDKATGDIVKTDVELPLFIRKVDKGGFELTATISPGNRAEVVKAPPKQKTEKASK